VKVHSLQKNEKVVVFSPDFSTPLEMVEYWAKKNPDKQALVYDSGQSVRSWTYTELATALKQMMQYLAEQLPNTSTSQPTVAFCYENSPEIILLNYACWSLGWISVPLDSTRDSLERKIYKLTQANAQLYFSSNNTTSEKEIHSIQQALPNLTYIETNQNFVAELSAYPLVERTSIQQPTITAETPALVLYTSGTTALPKGAMLTWSSLTANAQSIADWLKFTTEDRWLVLMPLHHINSTTFSLTTMLKDGTVVLVPKYSKSNFWKTLAEHACTGTSIVPTIAYDQLSEIEAFKQHATNLSQVTRMQLGSAPVQPTTVQQFFERFLIPLVQGYGQTETSLRSTGVPFPANSDEFHWAVESNTLGTELAYTNVTVLGEDGHELPENEVGEICVRGPIIMQGYLNNAEATEEAFKNDWFHSGDTGYWQEQYGKRFFFLKGRTKEIIKKGGVLISPLAIENELLKAYPELEQVYVVGFADHRLGENIGCIAVSQNSDVVNQILEEAKEGKLNSLKEFELPVAGIQIPANQLPLTSTGKVQRIELKQQFGPILKEQHATIAETERFRFRLIDPSETDLLEQAVAVNNQRWGKHLASTLEEFQERAGHGILIGLFDRSQPAELLGTVSGLQLKESDVKAIGTVGHWANTWDGITDFGRCYKSTPRGNCLVLFAISVMSKSEKELDLLQHTSRSCPRHQLAEVEQYCQSGQDPVLSFHAKAKAGLSTGAAVQKIIPNGRPADWEACGYSVIMEYPPLTHTPTINPSTSKGTQLLESAFVFAFQQKITQVYAYSRPSGLHHFLEKNSLSK